MVSFPSLLEGLAKTVSVKKERNSQRNAEKETKESKKKELMVKSSGVARSNKYNNFASVYTKEDRRVSTRIDSLYGIGRNLDAKRTRPSAGCLMDMVPGAMLLPKRVRKSLPSSLLRSWQENLGLASLGKDFEAGLERNLSLFEVWKQSYINTYAAIDQQLKLHPGIDSSSSGTTALTLVKHGEHLVVANVGDSRAVLATTSDDGSLVALQLTVDFKPNLPEEAERIIQSRGRIFCLNDEPGVYRVWMPNGRTPGLAMSRSLGDYCVKDFGLISVPDVTHRNITSRDQFVILATDGVWDIVSNQEAVKIVSSAADKEKSAKRLVEYAVRAWKYKRRGIAMDDISAICLFFHTPPSHQEPHNLPVSTKATSTRDG